MSSGARPGPIRARNDRPSSAGLVVLRALARAGNSLTLLELHSLLSGHPNSTRAQLDQLVRAGFVETEMAPAQGRGRPARQYRATVSGVQVATEDPDRDLDTSLLESVVEVLAAGSDPVGTAQRVGRSWGRRLGGRDIVDALARQGFTPQATDGQILLHTCPMLDAAEAHRDVTCAIHQGMIDEISATPMKLNPFAKPGACVLTLRD